MKALVSIPKGTVFDTFFTRDNIRLAESLGEIIWNDSTEQMTERELAERLGDCDTYVTLWKSPALTGAVLDRAPNLKLLVHLGSTIVPFVSDAMWEREIKAISGFHYYAESTAEGAIAYILTAQRQIPYYSDRLKREGEWNAGGFTDSLIHKTVGIVSYGGVGQHMVRMLSSFHVKIKVYDIREIPLAEQEAYGFEQCGIEELFSTCDIISLHTPYNENTHHLVNDRLMSMMKQNALLVNTARGGIIDQAALTRHLQGGKIRAALDVLEKEPIDKNDPLLRLDNVLLTPHQAGVSTNLRALLTKDLLQEGADYIDRGAPLKNEITRAYARGMSKR